jgi:hypothetical protein
MSRKHKHRKHRNKHECCSGGNQHKCGGNCHCNRVDRVEITTEAELWALVNLISNQGKKRVNKQLQREENLAKAMLEDVVPTDTETPVNPLTPIESAI